MSALRWIAPFAVVLAAAYLLALQPQRDGLDELRASIERLKLEYVEKKKVALNRDLYRAQLGEAEAALRGLMHALPNRIDGGFTALRRAAQARGVRLEELRLEGEERTREFYAERSASLKASGRFHDLGAFAADLAAAPGSLVLEGLSLDASPPGLVTLAATVRSFRYRDEDEIAAERRRGRARGKKG